MGLSIPVGDALLNALLLGGTFTGPSRRYIGLMDEVGRELRGTGYRRQRAEFAAPQDGAAFNSALIGFPPAGGAWGTAVGVGVFDTETGGSPILTSPLDEQYDLDLGDRMEFEPGALTFSVEGTG